MKFYGAFEKVEPQDDGTIKVWGVASSEAVDGAKEVVKADAMRKALPGFMEYANVREMHGKVAAGVCFEANVDDDGKTRIGAHIVDPVSVKKVQTNVLKGFSIGGSITERDDTDKTIIKGIDLTEISLVDRPCNPDARISLWKADGVSEYPENVETAIDLLLKELAANQIAPADALAKIAERPDVSPSSGTGKYGDVTFADEKNKKYPIDTEAHIRAAWNYINKPKNSGQYSAADAASIKAKIVAAWKDKIDKAGPPSADSSDKALDAKTLRKLDCESRAALLLNNPKAQTVLKSLAVMAGDKLEKGLWTVSSLACLIGNLFDLQQSVAQETAYEGDGSVLPDELQDAVQDLGEILQHMAAEELEELFPDDQEGDDVDFDSMVVQMAASVADLKKANDAILAKAGAKHSADTIEKLKGIHDTVAGMAPQVCSGSDDDDDSDDGKAARATMQKALGIVAEHAPMTDIAKKVETMHASLQETQAALAKVTTEREQFAKLLEEADTALKEAASHIDKLSAEPTNTGPLRNGLRLVAKADDTTEPSDKAATEKVIDADPPVMKDGKPDLVATAIRKSFRSGGKPFSMQKTS